MPEILYPKLIIPGKLNLDPKPDIMPESLSTGP